MLGQPLCNVPGHSDVESIFGILKDIDPIRIGHQRMGLRGRDLNPRPSGYEPDELPGCSTPRLEVSSMAHHATSATAKTSTQVISPRRTRRFQETVGSSASISFGTRSHRAALPIVSKILTLRN